MSDFNLVTNGDQEHFDLPANQDANLDSLLSDEVVMQWLMDLDAEDQASDSKTNDAVAFGTRMHG